MWQRPNYANKDSELTGYLYGYQVLNYSGKVYCENTFILLIFVFERFV